MSSTEAGCLAVFCTIVAVILGYLAVQAYLASPDPWGSAGLAVLAIAGLFLLWWLFGKADPTGLQLSRKTTAKLEEEDADRAAGLTMGWILFGSAVLLVVALMVSGALR